MKLNFKKAIAEAEKRVKERKFPAWLSNLCIDSTADIKAIALVAFEEGRLQVLEQLIDYQNEACKSPRWHQFKINSEGIELASVGEFSEMSVQDWGGYLSAKETVKKLIKE